MELKVEPNSRAMVNDCGASFVAPAGTEVIVAAIANERPANSKVLLAVPNRKPFWTWTPRNGLIPIEGRRELTEEEEDLVDRAIAANQDKEGKWVFCGNV